MGFSTLFLTSSFISIQNWQVNHSSQSAFDSWHTMPVLTFSKKNGFIEICLFGSHQQLLFIDALCNWLHRITHNKWNIFFSWKYSVTQQTFICKLDLVGEKETENKRQRELPYLQGLIVTHPQKSVSHSGVSFPSKRKRILFSISLLFHFCRRENRGRFFLKEFFSPPLFLSTSTSKLFSLISLATSWTHFTSIDIPNHKNSKPRSYLENI